MPMPKWGPSGSVCETVAHQCQRCAKGKGHGSKNKGDAAGQKKLVGLNGCRHGKCSLNKIVSLERKCNFFILNNCTIYNCSVNNFFNSLLIHYRMGHRPIGRRPDIRDLCNWTNFF